MNSVQPFSRGGLEAARTHLGETQAQALFLQTAQTSKTQAAALLGDRNLRFRTFFIVTEHFGTYGVEAELGARERTALKVCALALKEPQLQALAPSAPLAYDEQLHGVLRWIIRTGVQDDGADARYAQTLDYAAALLTDRFDDDGLLALLVDLLFRRAREGRNIHDLCWALFHGGNPHVLRLTAGYLRTPYAQDYELACVLLHLAPLPPQEREKKRQQQYAAYLAWLNDNYGYLYPSDESLQQSSEPECFAVDVAAKYLARPTLLRRSEAAVAVMASGEISAPPDDFTRLTEPHKRLLADYSNALHRKDRALWNRFMALSVQEQLSQALEDAHRRADP